MDLKEIIKYQIISNTGINKQNAENGLIYTILIFFFLSILEDVFKYLPLIIKYIQNTCYKKVQKTMDSTITIPKKLEDYSVKLDSQHFIYNISMIRHFSKNEKSRDEHSSSIGDVSNEMIDAVLNKISMLKNVPSFRLISRGQIITDFSDSPVELERNVKISDDYEAVSGSIYFKIAKTLYGEDNKLNVIEINLYSNTLTANELIRYTRKVYENYVQELKNSLGNKIYYFDQKVKDMGVSPPKSTDNEAFRNYQLMLIQNAPKQLGFSMDQFHSNKNFTNIYGEDVHKVFSRLTFFLNNKDWYDKKGIPYQFNILLSGIPGAGKTSIIKAIANECKNRHLINTKFSNIRTATQFQNLLCNDKLLVYTDNNLGNTKTYDIPIQNRIYLFEEVDAVGNSILKDRKLISNSSTDPIGDQLTLNDVLVSLDGTREISGRIIIFTTNYPELLDDALYRPGRIDLKINFDYATRQLICEMYKGYIDKTFPKEYINRLPDKKLSPAEIGEVLLSYSHNFQQIKEETYENELDRKLDDCLDNSDNTQALNFIKDLNRVVTKKEEIKAKKKEEMDQIKTREASQEERNKKELKKIKKIAEIPDEEDEKEEKKEIESKNDEKTLEEFNFKGININFSTSAYNDKNFQSVDSFTSSVDDYCTLDFSLENKEENNTEITFNFDFVKTLEDYFKGNIDVSSASRNLSLTQGSDYIGSNDEIIESIKIVQNLPKIYDSKMPDVLKVSLAEKFIKSLYQFRGRTEFYNANYLDDELYKINCIIKTGAKSQLSENFNKEHFKLIDKYNRPGLGVDHNDKNFKEEQRILFENFKNEQDKLKNEVNHIDYEKMKEIIENIDYKTKNR